MPRLLRVSGLSRISLVCLVTSITPLIAATQSSLITPTHISDLLPRQAATCGGKPGLQQCGTGFPSDFCCPSDTTCMSLNSADVQSVICCPAGSDCAFIQTITCDVSQLNATLHPDNQIHLSDTVDVELPTCGDKCCPLSYTCKGNMCSKDAPPAIPTLSTTAVPTSFTTTTATATATATPTSSFTPPASASQTSAPVQTHQGFDSKSFVAGLFPGIVIGALGTLGLLWVIKKRRESLANRYSGDFGHVSRKISDPIYDPEHAARTDFIRRGSLSAQPSPNSALTMLHNKPTNVGSNSTSGMMQNKPTNVGSNPTLRIVNNKPTNMGSNSSLGIVNNKPTNMGSNSALGIVHNKPTNMGSNTALGIVHNKPTNMESNSPSSMEHNKPTNVGWEAITGTNLTPRLKTMWDRTPKLNFGFTPSPPPLAVRAGRDRDPFTTPHHTPKRIHSTRRTSRTQNSEATRVASSSHNSPPTRTASTETIDVLMSPPSFLESPHAPAMRENRYTAASSNTTFTKLMERAGFDEEERRDWRSPRKI